MGIKRYQPGWNFGMQAIVYSEIVNGTFVKYSDHAAEVARLNERSLALATENAALKDFGGTLKDMHNALNGVGGSSQGVAEVVCQQIGIEAVMDAFEEIETMATDAILREVGAREVDEFAKNIGSPYAEGAGETYQDGFNRAMEVMQKKARDYVARIRAGELQP